MRARTTTSATSGFTLVEVSLAVVVVGLGLLALFGLFPSGLRSGEDALADTRAALFASVVMDGMRANASTVSNWAEWNDAVGMTARMCTSVDGVGTLTAGGSIVTINDYPIGSLQRIRYALTIRRATSRGYYAHLKVWERTGDFYNQFYSEFSFGGR
jgi:type IV pilus modification protein PilV